MIYTEKMRQKNEGIKLEKLVSTEVSLNTGMCVLRFGHCRTETIQTCGDNSHLK